MRRLGWAAVLAAALASPAPAENLQEAISLALAREPGLKRAEAQAEAAQSRLRQAKAARLPSLSLAGQAGAARMDYGAFFGFGSRDISPSALRLTLQQPLYAGGGLSAAAAQAVAGQDAAKNQLLAARLELEARVAEAYGQVLVAEEASRLSDRRLAAAAEVARQAGLRFDSGEAARSDLLQAQARAAEAEAGRAQAQADLAQARARYRALVGQEPGALAPFGPPPPMPSSLAEALARARSESPALAAAQAATRAAGAGERKARSGLLPEISLVAEASRQRDQFLPGYQADGYALGVQGRWTLFSSGLQSARIAEARAERHAAEASLAQAAFAVDEGVVTLWNAVEAADRMADAARQQVTAAEAAEASLGHEVRVSARPMIDLLNAQRESLAARTALAKARAAQVVTRYQLRSVVGDASQSGGGTGSSRR